MGGEEAGQNKGFSSLMHSFLIVDVWRGKRTHVGPSHALPDSHACTHACTQRCAIHAKRILKGNYYIFSWHSVANTESFADPPDKVTMAN